MIQIGDRETNAGYKKKKKKRCYTVPNEKVEKMID
jgi:hypothetical protein